MLQKTSGHRSLLVIQSKKNDGVTSVINQLQLVTSLEWNF